MCVLLCYQGVMFPFEAPTCYTTQSSNRFQHIYLTPVRNFSSGRETMRLAADEKLASKSQAVGGLLRLIGKQGMTPPHAAKRPHEP